MSEAPAFCFTVPRARFRSLENYNPGTLFQMLVLRRDQVEILRTRLSAGVSVLDTETLPRTLRMI